MRHLTIKVRITLWCLIMTALAAGIALNILFAGERRMTLEYYQETLHSSAQLAAGGIEYDNGRLEIDRDLDDLPNVRTAIYSLDGQLIYGQQRFSLPFEANVYRETTGRTGVQWYVLDKYLDLGDDPGLWLRLYISTDSMANLFSHRSDLLLLVLPVLVILATLGGYMIARNAVKPVIRITRTAESIADGKDLNQRIALPGARDELYHLAQVFDAMLERLSSAFERERRFTSDASHELRTPIAGILAQSDFALSENADDEDRRTALKSIRSRAADMSALIGKLLTLSRMDAGQMPIRPEPIDLNMMLEIAAMQLESSALEKGMSIIVESSSPVEALCDQTMMMQAVLNLISNAIKHGCPADKGGEIRLSAGINEGMAHLSVSDNGPGIDPESLSHIFDRFYQADASRHQDGAGLGLALVRQIARLHGGDTAVESTPGKGSRFTIYFPAKRRGFMKRIMLLVLAIVLSTAGCALGESLIPESAVMVSETNAGALKIAIYEIPETGEQLTLTADAATGEMHSLYGMCNTLADGAPMDTDKAKALIAEAHPDMLIVSSSEDTIDIGTVRILHVFAENYYGSIYLDAYGICGRNLTFASCMQNGRLNMQGAVSIMKLLRPEAALSGVELDEDDGLLLYEGDAYVDGVEYEFELDAHTGQLLQWDRD